MPAKTARRIRNAEAPPSPHDVVEARIGLLRRIADILETLLSLFDHIVPETKIQSSGGDGAGTSDLTLDGGV
jgi:hypothetical protein